MKNVDITAFIPCGGGRSHPLGAAFTVSRNRGER